MQNASSSLSNNVVRPYFQQQLTIDELNHHHLTRVIAHQGGWLTLVGANGPIQLTLPGKWRQRSPEDQPIIGDWLVVTHDNEPLRLLERLSLLSRRSSGHGQHTQYMAANIDTLFIVSSCNKDFSLSRIERYLALAHEGGAQPVVILTKSDLTDDAEFYRHETEKLRSGFMTLTLDARSLDIRNALSPWITPGETIAFMGSSGVGKSTLINTLLNQEKRPTQPARSQDDKGRHTTTSRSLFQMESGSWLLDTPGMRELRLGESEQGLKETFSDIEKLAEQCRYRDCSHEKTAGCAVLAEVDTGSLPARRLDNYLKLQREQTYLKETKWQQRDRGRRFSRMVNQVKKQQKM